MKPWSQTEFWCEVIVVLGGIDAIWKFKRDLRLERQKQNPDQAAVKKIQSQEWCVWILTTIGFVALLRFAAS